VARGVRPPPVEGEQLPECLSALVRALLLLGPFGGELLDKVVEVEPARGGVPDQVGGGQMIEQALGLQPIQLGDRPARDTVEIWPWDETEQPEEPGQGWLQRAVGQVEGEPDRCLVIALDLHRVELAAGTQLQHVVRDGVARGTGQVARRDPEAQRIQIGSMAGTEITLPSFVLRAANLRIMGSGQGSVTAAGIIAELPSLIDRFAAGTLTATALPVPLTDVETAWSSPTKPGERVVFTTSS
jgi:hypothetical protein